MIELLVGVTLVVVELLAVKQIVNLDLPIIDPRNEKKSA